MESYNFSCTVMGSLSNIVVVYENILSDDDCELPYQIHLLIERLNTEHPRGIYRSFSFKVITASLHEVVSIEITRLSPTDKTAKGMVLSSISLA